MKGDKRIIELLKIIRVFGQVDLRTLVLICNETSRGVGGLLKGPLAKGVVKRDALPHYNPVRTRTVLYSMVDPQTLDDYVGQLQGKP